MVKIFVTGYDKIYEEFPVKQDDFYLGSWCFGSNSNFSYSDQEKYQIIESPYNSWEEFIHSKNYVDSLIEKAIESITQFIILHYDDTYSEKFWRTYYTTKLSHLLDILYDRYIRLQKINEYSEPFLIPIITCKNTKFQFTYSNYGYSEFNFHEGNLYLFSHYLQNIESFHKHKLMEIEPSHEFWLEAGAERSEEKNIGFKEKIKRKIDSMFNKNSNLHLGTIYGMSYLDKLHIFSSLFGIHATIKNLFQNIGQLAKNQHKTLQPFPEVALDIQANNEFDKWISENLSSFLPIPTKAILETLKNQYAKVWIGSDIYTNKELEISGVQERKGKWISPQHGGGYGHFYSFPIGRTEYKSSESFLSWGWEYNHNYDTNNIKYLPSPMLSQIANCGRKKNVKNIVLISTCHPMYLYRFHSTLLPEQQLDYIETKINFYNVLEREIKEEVYYRPYPTDYGQNEMSILGKYYKNIDRNAYKKPHSIYESYKLVIVDQLATSNLFTFAMNIPTIIFFKRDHFEYCKESEPFFQKLIGAGILFHDEELAAKKVNEIYEDIDGWWNQPEVQKAKDEFAYMYARTDKNWKKIWIDYIQEQLSELESV